MTLCAPACPHHRALYGEEQSSATGWEAHTVVMEGALLLMDLRSPVLRCLLCNWFNECARSSLTSGGDSGGDGDGGRSILLVTPARRRVGVQPIRDVSPVACRLA